MAIEIMENTRYDKIGRNYNKTGWNRPEIYLNPQVRQNMSGFAVASPAIVQKGVAALHAHLESGKWDRMYGDLRKKNILMPDFVSLNFLHSGSLKLNFVYRFRRFIEQKWFCL